MQIVNLIVDRCHVAETNRAVVRYFISRLKNGYTTWKAADKSVRREYLDAVVQRHAANRRLYHTVMRG